jgi:hypothetical protein
VHLLGGAVETDHRTEVIAEPVPMRLRKIVHLVFDRYLFTKGLRVKSWTRVGLSAAFCTRRGG